MNNPFCCAEPVSATMLATPLHYKIGGCGRVFIMLNKVVPTKTQTIGGTNTIVKTGDHVDLIGGQTITVTTQELRDALLGSAAFKRIATAV